MKSPSSCQSLVHMRSFLETGGKILRAFVDALHTSKYDYYYYYYYYNYYYFFFYFYYHLRASLMHASKYGMSVIVSWSTFPSCASSTSSTSSIRVSWE